MSSHARNQPSIWESTIPVWPKRTPFKPLLQPDIPFPIPPSKYILLILFGHLCPFLLPSIIPYHPLHWWKTHDHVMSHESNFATKNYWCIFIFFWPICNLLNICRHCPFSTSIPSLSISRQSCLQFAIWPLHFFVNTNIVPWMHSGNNTTFLAQKHSIPF